MDCYFHSNVPSVAPCTDCGKPICATCRDERGGCPSCRLAAKVEAATATRRRFPAKCRPEPRRRRARPSDRRRAVRPGRVARARRARLPALAAGAALAPRPQAISHFATASVSGAWFQRGFLGFRRSSHADRASAVPWFFSLGTVPLFRRSFLSRASITASRPGTATTCAYRSSRAGSRTYSSRSSDSTPNSR